jgi:hypothetical protein
MKIHTYRNMWKQSTVKNMTRYNKLGSKDQIREFGGLLQGAVALKSGNLCGRSKDLIWPLV